VGEDQVVTSIPVSLPAEACGLEDASTSGLLPGERIVIQDFPASTNVSAKP
jgi:hypothetical protein